MSTSHQAQTTPATLVPYTGGASGIGSSTLLASDFDDDVHAADTVPTPGARPPADSAGVRFSLVSELGRGGLGEVFAADDRDIGRRVAIKRVRADRRTGGVSARFVQEVRTVGQLEHPNIVPIHDIGRQEDGGLYFVMRYLEGETVESLIQRLRAGDREAHATWTFERRVELFRQVLHAIGFAHDRGFVHRDIKPANVMVGKHGEVSVVDWGLAKRLDAIESPGTEPSDGAVRDSVETRAGSLVGTPMYMAPEQARGEPADVRTDVWQLSLLFYELLTLEHYLGDLADAALPDLLDGIANRPVPLPRSIRSKHQPPVPAELGHYLMHGLKKDPSERYASVAVMLTRLDQRSDGAIPVECPVTFQKWTLLKALKFVDLHPRASLGVVIGALLASIAGLAVMTVVALGLAAGWIVALT